MRGVVVESPGRAVVREIPEPNLAPGQVLVGVERAGICGSDLAVFQGTRDVKYPLVMGHEAVGRIVEPGDSHHSRDARVVIEPNIPCGNCPVCQRGFGNVCPFKCSLGMNHAGVFADFVAISAKFVHELPPEVSMHDGVGIEPLAVALHAFGAGQVIEGDAVAVIGCGAEGLLLVQVAVALGARVLAADIRTKSLDAALRLGAERLFVVPVDGSIYSAVDLLNREWCPAVVFESAGVASAVELALQLVTPGGRVVVLGLGTTPVAVVPLAFVRRGLSLIGSLIYDHPNLGLTLDLFQPFRDLEGVPDDVFKRNLDRAERKFDVMAELGAPTMLVCSNVGSQAIADADRSAGQLHALAERAAQRNMRIAYEALAWGRHVRTYGQAWSLVQRAAHPALGVCIDSFHTLALGDDPAGITDIPGDRIFFLQLADAPKLQMDVLSWSRHFRCFPGQGELDITPLLERVLLSGYRGPLSLEVFNDVFRSSDTRQTALDAMRSLRYLEESVAASPEVASLHLDLLEPPPRPALNGVAFLEFAVDADANRGLADWLAQLGFVRAGRHRSKDVTLYRQGQINLILDAEPDSFAQHYFQLHGPSLCAIALRTDAEAAALDRARAMLATQIEGRVGPNERNIPAIRMAELYGLMRSRAVVDRERRVRITLNASEGPNSMMARSLSTFAGAGVHHIALSCQNVFEVVQRLKANGVTLLAAPANYYDDLAARLDLRDDVLDRLRRDGVLYDRSTEGEFFHIPTEAFHGRFSFEIVQRGTGYQAHGEANAAAYLAAQARSLMDPVG
ncbi:MAG: TIM barrel protein [Chloroflexi bacterium]|nr:TIM barrel protein [Chloroflexota bacterium]